MNRLFSKIILVRPNIECIEVFNNDPCSVFVYDTNSSVNKEWQNRISDTIIESNCRYMVAFGPNSSSWDDSVDWACLAKTKYEFNDRNLCMTCWINNDTIESAIAFFIETALIDYEKQTRIILNLSNNEIDFEKYYKKS